jgi:hypothetical protein
MNVTGQYHKLDIKSRPFSTGAAAGDEVGAMKSKAFDGLQLVFGLALFAGSASKLPGGDVMVRQLDLIGLALIYRLRRATLAAFKRTKCLFGTDVGFSAVVLLSTLVVATIAQNAGLGVNPLPPLALLAVGESVIWARLRNVADDLRGRGVSDVVTHKSADRSQGRDGSRRHPSGEVQSDDQS